MSRYTIPLIEKRLAEIAKEYAQCVDVCDERSDTYFRLIEQFNESRDVTEKVAIAKKAQVALEKMRTWTQRSDKAWKKRGELDLERNELGNELWILRNREERTNGTK